jgi:osmotically-inducible protein OsmY
LFQESTAMTADEVLQLNVLRELEWDPKVDAARVGVAARNGVITLTGEVDTYAEKLAAEEAARRVKGVCALAREIEVRLPQQPHRSDTDIAERALRILEWDVRVPNDKVSVEVAHGWITLRGEVEWYHQKLAAEDSVRKLSGVRGVTNSISVKPASVVGDVRTKIEDAFKRYAELEAGHISIAVSGGKVVLSGKVDTWHEREMAEQAAWSAPGVSLVEDKIVIAP